MATAESVKSKIQGLIESANAVTGQSDTDMTTALATLIAGFGAGGASQTVYTGTYRTEVRVVEDLEFSTPKGVDHFVLFISEAPATNVGMAFCVALMGYREGVTIQCGSNNSGGSVSGGTSYAIGSSYSYYYGVKFEEDRVKVLASSAAENYCRVLQPGKTYIWIAW